MPDPVFTYRKRAFLAPLSTGFTSHIFAEVESSREGEYKFGSNLIYLADCEHTIMLEFFLGTKQRRRQSLAKINLLIDIFTQYRDALLKEIALIEKEQ